MGSLDRNADNSPRLRRNAQRGRATGTTGSVLVTAPLKNTGSTIQLLLLSTGGITTNTGSLTIKLDTNPGLVLSAAGLKMLLNANSGLSLAAGGVSIALQTNPGLVLGATGIALQLADTTLKLAAGGVSVQLNAAGAITNSTGLQVALTATGGLVIATNALGIKLDTNPGLVLASTGIKILLADTSMSLAVAGVAVNLAANSGLQVSAGLLLKLADTSLQLAAGGVSVLPATNGGLSVSSGLLARGLRIVAGTPAGLAAGDSWYDSTGKIAHVENETLVQNVAGLLFVNTADSTAVSNVAVQTNFSITFAIPANWFTAGKTIRVTTIGTYGVTGTPTVAFGLSVGGVRITTPAFTPTAGATGARWSMQLLTTCRSTGVSGSFSRSGFSYAEVSLGGTNTLYPGGGTANTADTTATITVSCDVTFSVANAANTATLHEMTIELL